MPLPWDSSVGPVDWAKYSLPGILRDAYEQIHNFLTSESAVRLQLQGLPHHLNANGFDLYLSGQEREMGLSTTVQTVHGLLSPSEFLAYVGQGKPINDLGARTAHGHSTHRVQWVMIANQFGRKCKGVEVHQLYRTLATDWARHLPGEFRGAAANEATEDDYDYLWDDLFEGYWNEMANSPGNAKSPEYLKAYNESEPDGARVVGWF